MHTLRRLGLVALFLGFAQVVFGAVVRITGSGLGCGDHWPDCYGTFTPAHGGVELLIEISHRYGAAALSIAVLALFVTAWTKRDEDGVGGRGGSLRTAGIAFALVITAALFGAVTVKLGLATPVVVTHLAIAMTLLAVLVETVVRAGGFTRRPLPRPADASRSLGAARAAMGLAFITLLFGAITANTPGAPFACRGFPWCRSGMIAGMPLDLQITHRVIAFLLFGHLLGMMIASRKREPGSHVARAATVAFSLVTFQLLVGAALVEMHLPMGLRSFHQATGTLVWIAVATTFSLARPRGERGSLITEARRSAAVSAE
ncbi:MAG: COX15/CtaA family protein [Gemmatimonadota bacterium]|nr:COX15/CtaA family protein [Gemmatimonadota bacterium]